MEKTQPTTGQFALRYGLILGALTIVFSLMLHFMDMQYDQGMAKNIVSMIMLIGVIILAIIQFKKLNNSYISVSEALKIGVGTSLIGGIIAVLYILVYVNFIDPNFHEQIAELSRAGMIKQNPEMTQEQLDTAVEMQQKFFWVTYPFILIFNIFIGFVVSLITGLIVKKGKNEF
ncbi:hypothetical protein I215_02558 [Galbibacter marinus]|uniref:DUF4199 domain-containing protein n=1 Tax=Galbibacter marinus TaxID=555500 RepID=K2P5W0_9FLAO|nr:DUF4199 domain-containing protein [Galbibacter marinus]EKF56368.1 hypothetical protein I215_02558 [Galbibacter marinus]